MKEANREKEGNGLIDKKVLLWTFTPTKMYFPQLHRTWIIFSFALLLLSVFTRKLLHRDWVKDKKVHCEPLLLQKCIFLNCFELGQFCYFALLLLSVVTRKLLHRDWVTEWSTKKFIVNLYSYKNVFSSIASNHGFYTRWLLISLCAHME